MNQEQLRKKIQHSLNEGYTEGELRKVLKQQGFSQQQINRAFREAKSQETPEQKRRRQRPDQASQNDQRNQGQEQNSNLRTQGDDSRAGGFEEGSRQVGDQASPGEQSNRSISDSAFSSSGQDNSGSDRGMQQEVADQSSNQMQQRGQGNRSAGGDAAPGIDLTGSKYVIKQDLLLRRYSVYADEEKVLKAKKKLLSIKTEIPFRLPGEGEEVFRAESERLLNISNNYDLKDSNGEELAVIDRKRTLFNQVWRVRNPEDNGIAAEIKTASQAAMALRIIGSRIPLLGMLTALIPHTYRIEDNNGQQIGELAGELSIRDRYELKLQDSGSLDREAMIAAVIAIDALEGN